MIYDCFPFFNELDILELRLNILYDFVDKFVIVEGNKTHTGGDKEFIFEKINKNIQTFKKTQFCLKISNVFPKYFLQNIDKYEKFICKERQIPYWVAFLYIYCIKILKALRLY